MSKTVNSVLIGLLLTQPVETIMILFQRFPYAGINPKINKRFFPCRSDYRLPKFHRNLLHNFVSNSCWQQKSQTKRQTERKKKARNRR